jgi:L-cysteine S-thiosulfotransferase
VEAAVAKGASTRDSYRMNLTRLALSVLIVLVPALARAQDRPLQPLPGRHFQSTATQALQDDDGANPAMLWIEQGASFWMRPAGAAGKACATCHGDATLSMAGVAARYPAVSAEGAVLNLEGRINTCRTTQQLAPGLAYESNELLALTGYVAMQSRGLPRNVSIAGPARPVFERGQAFWQLRQGQMNLSCAQCHDDNVGRKLRGDTISQGQSHGWPGYRLEWQSLGSLQRRLRACSLGVRAEILDYGAPEYLAVELYLAWRGAALPSESPGVRR